jgi:hypothetical protein
MVLEDDRYGSFKFVDRISKGAQLPRFGDGSAVATTYGIDIVDGVVRTLSIVRTPTTK